MSRPGRARMSRRALILIAALFVTSGVLRVATETGPAIAREIQELPTGDLTVADDGALASCEPEPGIALLLSELRDRETKVAAQEEALDARFAALSEAEASIAEQLALLTDTEAALEQTLALADGAAENDISQLTRVYENMKPKEAAALFEEMDHRFAAGFLARMRPDAAASIMAGLEPETAYAMSLILAGRNMDVPTE